MFRNIREPGGIIGAFSAAATVLLALSGIFAIAVLARNDQGFDAPVLTAWAVVAAAIWPGCVGFALGRRQPVLGGALVVVGALAFATFFFWALLPLLLGPAIAVLGVIRARRLSERAPGFAAA